ncbi:MAG: hypothetical protein ACTSRG_03040 [Candidatus Helarchaeota archaeon]
MTQKSVKKEKSALEEKFFLIFGIVLIGYGIFLLITTFINPGFVVLGFGICSVLVYIAEKYWMR